MNASENDNAHGCKKALLGGPALQARWMMCEARSAANSEFVQEPVDLKCFRQFRWMLTPAQETTLQEWEARALETGRERLANARNQALKDMEEDSAKKKRPPPLEDLVAAPAITKLKIKTNKDKPSSSSHQPDADDGEGELPREEDCAASGLLQFFGAKAM